MSVIVKGMKMPKSCMECVINHSFFKVLKCSQLKGMKGFKNYVDDNDNDALRDAGTFESDERGVIKWQHTDQQAPKR